MLSNARRTQWLGAVATLVALAVAAPAQAQVQTPAAFGSCGKYDAERVWRGSDLPQRIEAEWGETFTPAGDVFGVYKQYCRDLTGDGVREMVIALGGPTVSSPEPWAIYQVDATGTPQIAFAEIKVSY